MLMKLFEGKYDELTGVLVDVIWHFIKNSKKLYDETGQDLYATRIFKSNEIIEELLSFKYQIIINRREQIDGDFQIFAITHNNKITITIYLEPETEPKSYSELNSDLQGTMRHELEHILQEKNIGDRPKTPSRYILKKLNDDPFRYFMSDHEVAAMAIGFYKVAKTKKEKLDTVIDDYLSYFEESLTPDQIDQIKQKWIDYAMKNLPKAQYSSKLVRESFDDYLEFSDGDEKKYDLQRKLVVDPLKGQHGDTKISWEEYMENKDIIDDNFDVEFLEYGKSPVRILPKEGDEETAWWLEDK